ncbi:hypothetical protein CAC42_7920 [Sphaceloma murrayae]|uniref:Lipase B n=1 Tax=Sphaceloma murrayae TaxID=2082308 RepID=A0A2K1QYG5_9PEZI|nr:hypothetical protein CAC42_7920 [Sphaceloma murrayae]
MKVSLVLLSLSTAISALPAAAPNSPTKLEERQLIGGLLNGLLGGINDTISKGDVNGLLDNLRKVQPSATPSTPEQARSALTQIIQTSKPQNIHEYGALLSANGLISGTLASLINGIGGQFTGQNSASNSNPDPPSPVYPKKLPCDAPYTVSESALRSAIYIPPTFTRGQKPPVILFPGTGNTGFQTFAGNFIKLLSGQSWADPVWVNVPKSMLDDAQINAQYAAYALNYIASLTGRNTTMVAWSQGNLSSQWAYKYWPSTRATTSDHIAISADYAGTILANFICPDGLAPCNPSVYQQQYLSDSNFITALRANGGDSGYIPTTTIYSGLLDEIVQPQTGTAASSFLKDDRRVGVTNNEVQFVCPGALAGSLYTHEGVLYNPLSLALLKDAMAHPGPGRVDRLPDLKSVCASFLAPGLGLADLVLTETAVVFAGLNILVGQPRTPIEPALQAFAKTDGATCSATTAGTAARNVPVRGVRAGKKSGW